MGFVWCGVVWERVFIGGGLVCLVCGYCGWDFGDVLLVVVVMGKFSVYGVVGWIGLGLWRFWILGVRR